MIQIRIYPPITHFNSDGYSCPLTSLPSPPTDIEKKQAYLPESYDTMMNPVSPINYLAMESISIVYQNLQH